MSEAPEVIGKIRNAKKEFVKELEIEGKKVEIAIKPIEAIRIHDVKGMDLKLERRIVVKVDGSEEISITLEKEVRYTNPYVEQFMYDLAKALDEMQAELEQKLPKVEEVAKAIAYILA